MPRAARAWIRDPGDRAGAVTLRTLLGVTQRLDRTTLSILRAAFAGSSCSQTTTSFQPDRRSCLAVSRSLALLPAIFCSHHWELFFGVRWWWGHPCQKHPRTSTTTLAGPNTTSCFRRLENTLRCFLNLSPSLWSSLLSAVSGAVSLVACDLILFLVASSFGVGDERRPSGRGFPEGLALRGSGLAVTPPRR